MLRTGSADNIIISTRNNVEWNNLCLLYNCINCSWWDEGSHSSINPRDGKLIYNQLLVVISGLMIPAPTGGVWPAPALSKLTCQNQAAALNYVRHGPRGEGGWGCQPIKGQRCQRGSIRGRNNAGCWGRANSWSSDLAWIYSNLKLT